MVDVGNCVTATDDLSAQELFQIATVNGSSSYYIRPKAQTASANGEVYCVNINTGQPAVAPCSNASAIWAVQTWAEQSTRDGWYFYTTAAGDSQRLYLSDNETYSLKSYSSSTPQSEQDLMQWGVSSRGVIDDQSYSTASFGNMIRSSSSTNIVQVPAAITNGAITTTTTSSTNSTSASTSSSSVTSTLNFSSAGSTSSSGLSISTSASPSESTVTMVVTPTITASHPTSLGASESSSTTVTPALRNEAHRAGMDVKSLLAVVIVLPQMLRWLY